MRFLTLLSLAAVTATVGACGGSSLYGSNDGPTNPGTTNTTLGPNDVDIQNTAFSPSTRTVSAGATVTWHWDDCSNSGYGSTCVTHNVTFDDGSGIASSSQSTGTYSRTFATAGTYKYHCTIHGAAMSGTVVVQ
ncbi:MAG TPA: plastocyanin/azurin family copper-binding protein [Gemmatimonadaceae bacterium]|jgi:plastocyanin